MEDSSGSRQQQGGEQPVRSRWTPKPEQILILETIFNSGMVNPPKDETVRIRKLLEKFGSVADANVFYWFQNRRSRSRRRQRQVQATLSAAAHHQPPPPNPNANAGVHHFDHHHHHASFPAVAATCFDPNSSSSPFSSFSNYSTSSGPYSGSSSFGVENSSSFFGLSAYPGFMQEFEDNPIFSPAQASNSPIQSETETVMVFINGVATEVGRGALDIKSVFGGDFVLFHCSGVAVEMNEYGFLVQGLQHGESYFLVPRHP